jgi:hypothetical protein
MFPHQLYPLEDYYLRYGYSTLAPSPMSSCKLAPFISVPYPGAASARVVTSYSGGETRLINLSEMVMSPAARQPFPRPVRLFALLTRITISTAAERAKVHISPESPTP